MVIEKYEKKQATQKKEQQLLQLEQFSLEC